MRIELSRLFAVLACFISIALIPAPASAQSSSLPAADPIPLFSASAGTGRIGDPTDPSVGQTFYVDLNSALSDRLVNSPPTEFSTIRNIVARLGNNPSVRLFIKSRQVISETGTAVQGDILDVKGGHFALVIHKTGQMSGTFRLGKQLFRLMPAGGQVHALVEVNERSFPRDAEPLQPLFLETPSPTPRADGIADAGDVLDVLVLYTPQARTQAGGLAAIESMIDLAVAESNTGYTSSGVNLQLRLVNKQEVNYGEVDFGADLQNLAGTTDGFMDDVHALRDSLGADVVKLVRGSGEACGIAYLMSNLSAAFAASAFSVDSYNCITGYYTFAHEIGHNLGSMHDRAVSGGSQGLYPYSYGYVAPDTTWRTIMAYGNACSNCTRINRWSNAELDYLGVPTGVPVGNALEADNELSINNARVTASNWRQAVLEGPPALASPSPGSTLTSNSATFQWVKPGAPISQYWLYVGSTPGGNQYFDSGNIGTATSALVQNLRTDGSSVYVTLYYRANSSLSWSSVSATYTAFTAPLVCPSGSPNDLFLENWESGSAASWQVANAQGSNTWEISAANPDPIGSNLHYRGGDPATTSDSRSAMVSSVSIPAGARLHVRHQPRFEAGFDGGIIEVSSNNGTSWSQLPNAAFIFGGYNTAALATANPMGAIPAFSGNQTTYQSSIADLSAWADQSIRIRFRIGTDASVGSTGWDIDNVQIYTCGAPPIPAMASPASGSVLPGTSQVFTWTGNGSGAQNYWLYVGSTAGGAQYHDSGNLGTATSRTVNGLPNDGSTVYVRLWYQLPGTGIWLFIDDQYTATGTGGGLPGPATLLKSMRTGSSGLLDA